jgi:hypothetical protein
MNEIQESIGRGLAWLPDLQNHSDSEKRKNVCGLLREAEKSRAVQGEGTGRRYRSAKA